MAQQNSFDVVSEVNMQEVDNAINQTRKEVIQRYDLKDSKTEIDFNQKDKKITITSLNDFTYKSVNDVLQGKWIKRGLSIKSLSYGKIEQAHNAMARVVITITVGIDKEIAKEIVKFIKESKIKVQTQIMDEQIRVSGKDRDDLQQTIALLKGKDFNIPLQFVNYR
ncbi:MAG: YajQ family cyclic di-GMP-binding protein [Bacteroidetes bacterium]|nr:YajQ family cyclic di-GMP-binding protein [Bacteroidota bacterium]